MAKDSQKKTWLTAMAGILEKSLMFPNSVASISPSHFATKTFVSASLIDNILNLSWHGPNWSWKYLFLTQVKGFKFRLLLHTRLRWIIPVSFWYAMNGSAGERAQNEPLLLHQEFFFTIRYNTKNEAIFHQIPTLNSNMLTSFVTSHRSVADCVWLKALVSLALAWPAGPVWRSPAMPSVRY